MQKINIFFRVQMNGFRMTLVITCLVSLMGGPGCIIPAPVEQEVDGGVNRPPEILVGNSTPPPNKPLEVYRGEKRGFNIALRDEDKDPLSFRVFIDLDYKNPVPLSNDRAPGGATAHLFHIEGLCDVHVKDTAERHFLELYISDRPFLSVQGNPGAADYRQSVGGLRDNVGWILSCGISPTKK